MATMERMIEDISDPNSEKAALQFLGRAVAIWGNPEGTGSTINGLPQHAGSSLPGFERFIYERLVPATFRVLSLPGFSIKDGQLMTVCSQFVFYVDRLIIYLLRFHSRSPLSTRALLEFEDKRLWTFLCRCFYLHRIGHQRWLWILRPSCVTWITKHSKSTSQILFVLLEMPRILIFVMCVLD